MNNGVSHLHSCKYLPLLKKDQLILLFPWTQILVLLLAGSMTYSFDLSSLSFLTWKMGIITPTS